MIGAMVVTMFLAAPGVTGAVDGSCVSTTQPQLSALGEIVDSALTKIPVVVYRDGNDATDLPADEKARREIAINRATKARVPQPGKQIGNGRCAALALEAVMNSFPGRQTTLTDIVDHAKSKGWTEIGELNGPQIVDVATHFKYDAQRTGGLPSFETILSSAKDQPLLVGVSGNRSDDPTIKRYGGHMLIVTGAYELDGVKYVIGKDPNVDGDVAWKYDDLASATNETITVRPG